LNQKLSSKISSEDTTSPVSCRNCVALNPFKIESCISFEKFPIDMIFAKLFFRVINGNSIYGCDVLHRHIVFVILVLVVFLAIVCSCMTIASVFRIFFESDQVNGFVGSHSLTQKLRGEKLRVIGKHDFLLNTTSHKRAST